MKKNHRLFTAALLGLFAIISIGAGTAQAAGIALDRMVVDFNIGKRPVENLNVTNQGDKPVKVVARVVQIINPGQKSQADQPTDKLIIAPKTFEIAPGETRTARLVLKTQPEDIESLYRVSFTPSIPTFYKDETVKEGTSIHIGVIVAMGALVMVHPKEPKPSLKVARKGDKIDFINEGNVSAQLLREEFCTEDKKLCVPLEGRRIYPGATWEMEVPAALKGKSYEQTLLLNGKYSKLSYPSN